MARTARRPAHADRGLGGGAARRRTRLAAAHAGGAALSLEAGGMTLSRAIDGWRAYGLLALLSLALHLPGIATLPPTDRDEARFVQASRQMLESQDFLRIRFQDEPRNKKPAGI